MLGANLPAIQSPAFPLGIDQRRPLKKLHQHEPRDKAADVSPDGHPAAVAPAQLAEAQEQLDHDPVAQHHVGTHAEEPERREEDVHPDLRIKNEVGAKHPADRTGRAHRRDARARGQRDVRAARRQAGQEVED